MQEGPSKAVQAFLSDHIDSVGQIETLLLAYAQPDRGWTALDIARELRIDPAWAGSQLASLAGCGLLQTQNGLSPVVYKYAPRSPELDDTVSALAKDYAERRVTVIAAVYGKPVDKLRAFADAFRLRREEGR